MAINNQTQNMLKVGTTLSNRKYRIDQYLASGGFGNTYAATDTAFEEKVAIKELFIKGVCGRGTDSTEISISLTENQVAFAAQKEKFIKEARRLRKLVNPHIVKVHDLFEENGTSYYVMDFVEGESLSARMKRTKKPLSESELMHILPQVLDALECVHNKCIWHLDLKPANIMIDTEGNVQLIDFGASKQLRNENGDSLSTSSAMAYTPGFAPSEQLDQKIEKFGPWTDLYALGATIFNLLTMQQPPSPSDIEEDPAALKLPAHISAKTQKLVMWMMKPNRTLRPKNAQEVMKFLKETPDDTPPFVDAKIDKDDNATVISQKKPKDKQEHTDLIKKVVMWVVAACFIGAAIVIFNNLREGNVKLEPSAEEADTTLAIVFVTDYPVSVTSGPDNMRQYSYTGELADTLGALPNGKGTATFAKYGDIPGSTYEGEFVDGICEDYTGTATMTFTNGDKYVGTFKNGYYDTGKYILADKSYFKGTFKDGNPYNGNWYTANGANDGKVVNGVDQ